MIQIQYILFGYKHRGISTKTQVTRQGCDFSVQKKTVLFGWTFWLFLSKTVSTDSISPDFSPYHDQTLQKVYSEECPQEGGFAVYSGGKYNPEADFKPLLQDIRRYQQIQARRISAKNCKFGQKGYN